MVTQALAKKLTKSSQLKCKSICRTAASPSPSGQQSGRRHYDEFFLDGQPTEGEEAAQVQTNYELIVVVSQIGYSEMVMDAARSAGAGGGTVIHAKGTPAPIAPSIFRRILADEKK
jgi:hypothetical protein